MAFKQSNEGSSKRRRITRRNASRRPPQSLKGFISDDPGQSLRKLASIVGVSEPTMHRIAEEDLRYKSYTLKIQMLSEFTRTSRVARCNLLLCSLKNEASEWIRFFSKKFRKNFYYWCLNQSEEWPMARHPENVPIITRTKFPVNVHVLGVQWGWYHAITFL